MVQEADRRSHGDGEGAGANRYVPSEDTHQIYHRRYRENRRSDAERDQA